MASVQKSIKGDVNELKTRVKQVEGKMDTMTSQTIPDQTSQLKELEAEHQLSIANVDEMKRGLEELRQKMLIAWDENDSFKCNECEQK